MPAADPPAWPDPRPVYDAIADDYAAAYGRELRAKEFDRAVLDSVADRAGRGALAADLGCGPSAQIGVFLAKRGLRVVGLDLSARCAALSPLPTGVGDLRALPIGSGSLAAVTCFYAIIHLPRAAVPQALSELRRVLAPGGQVALTAHAGRGEMTRNGWFGYDGVVRATLFERDELHGMLAAAGLTDVRVARREPYPQEITTPRLYATAVAPAQSVGR